MSFFEFFGDDYFEGLFMKDLGRDEAYLRIINNGKKIPVYLLKLHKECIECDHHMDKVIYAIEDFKVNSKYKYRISNTEMDENGGKI
ncbi:hypothetical protein HHI36_017920 [Cryptolaemus montrouzieri]|uniref:Uncharacterized protein n=1 Tax=Cryptolaemus montrouzieri TaxID=559131 RepID=A0ABD2NZG3_9CUCU